MNGATTCNKVATKAPFSATKCNECNKVLKGCNRLYYYLIIY